MLLRKARDTTSQHHSGKSLLHGEKQKKQKQQQQKQ